MGNWNSGCPIKESRVLKNSIFSRGRRRVGVVF
jgi:hypothetical protein